VVFGPLPKGMSPCANPHDIMIEGLNRKRSSATSVHERSSSLQDSIGFQEDI